MTHPSSLSLTPSMWDLIRRQPKGHSLLGPFYRATDVYERDLATVWRKGWLFAVHSCEIPKPGDFCVVEMDKESIVVARGEKGEVHAFHNVCRHRGSLVCDQPQGRSKRFVCPYHQWSYGLDGRLL